VKKQKVIIIGADGFIGSRLAKRLALSGVSVLAFDKFRNGISKNFLEFSDNLIMVPGNFLISDDLRKSLKGVDYVFHFVSLTTPGSSMNDPLVDIEKNIIGSVVLFDECVRAGVKRIIFASSGGSIYGNQGKDRYSENDPTEPISPYAISKLCIEKFLSYYRVHHGLDSLILRFSNPYGPFQNYLGGQGLIPIFLNRIKKGEPIEIFGDGKFVRDYIYIDDLIQMTQQIYDRAIAYSIYNIGSGIGKSVNEIIQVLESVTCIQAKKVFKTSRDIDVKSVVLDTNRIKSELGEFEMCSLEAGVLESWNWIQNE
jgi:UDP-glucose 4-epimerase